MSSSSLLTPASIPTSTFTSTFTSTSPSPWSRYLFPLAFASGALVSALVSHYYHVTRHHSLQQQHHDIIQQHKQDHDTALKVARQEWEKQRQDEEDEDGEEDEESDQDEHQTRNTDLGAIKVPNVRHKMVLVVRKDLKMGTGKMCAQSAHAATGIVRELLTTNPQVILTWERWGQAKIAVQVQSEAELLNIAAVADAAGLPTYIVHDAGHTQVAPNTRTVLAVGPAPVADVDAVCSKLKLL